VKRIIDFLFSVVVVIILSPLLLVLAGLVRIKLGSPVLYRQPRPGLNGRLFELVKLRSMTDDRGSDGELLADSERLTSFGQFVRSTSLDELPELWNVIKGEMSLVGPRPLLAEYLDLYSAEQSRRHDVRPGITGWAQINGRNALSWEEKFEFDVWYVDNRSLWLDFKILLKTVTKVFQRDGVSQEGHVTMEPFRGSHE
jgi:sugar transferase EpsL